MEIGVCTFGGLHVEVMRSIELPGTEVAPAVRRDPGAGGDGAAGAGGAIPGEAGTAGPSDVD